MGIWKEFIKTQYEYWFSDVIKENIILIEDLKTKILYSSSSLIYPKSYGNITLSEVYTLLKAISKDVYLSDEQFNLTTKTEASKFSNETKVQYRNWIKEDHDCDNFSFALMGYWSEGLKSFATGIAWSASHAFNVMIDKDKKIWIIEPQSNKYFTLEEAKQLPQYYPMRLIVM